MRSLLGVGGYIAAVVGTAGMLLGKWLPAPTVRPAGPLGLLQAFHWCTVCGGEKAHIVHSTAARTCQTCGHHTHPERPL